MIQYSHLLPNRWRRLSVLLAMALASLCFSGFGQAATLNLTQAIKLTLSNSPELQTYVHRAEAAKGMVEQAAVGTSKKIDISVEDAFGTGQLSGIKSAQTNIQLAWLLEQPILDLRVSVAKSKTNINQLEKDINAVKVAANTAKLFINALSLKEQMKLATLSEQKARQAYEQISLLVKRGKLSAIDALRAKANLSKKSLLVEDLEHEILVAKNYLAAQWDGNADFVLAGNLLTIPLVANSTVLEKRLLKTPSYKLYGVKQTIVDREIQLAKMSINPAWEVRTGIRRNEALDDYAITAGVSIPWGRADRNNGKIASLKAEQLSQRSLANAWLTKAKAQVFQVNVQYKHFEHVIDALNSETLPTLTKANKAAQKTFTQGRFSYSDWYLIQQELIDTQFELIDAYTNVHLNQIQLEQLTASFIN
ncbi:TolC family protein [Shewanella sp. OPT22]|nr:TolC family protein [Shewanella sp. OPT22]